jgi:hypothetical protein
MAQVQQPTGFTSSPMTAAILGPDILARQLRLQQDAQYGQAMLDQGQQVPQGQMVSGRYVAPSWTQYLANGLKTYMGRQTLNNLPNEMAGLGQAQIDGVNRLFGVPGATTQPAGAASSAAPQSPPSVQAFSVGESGQPQNNQPVPTAQPVDQSPAMVSALRNQTPTTGSASAQPTPMAQPRLPLLPGKTRQESAQAYMMLGPQGYMNAFITQLVPIDLQKTLIAMGIQPGTPEYQQALALNVRKANYIAPVNIRPGGYTQEPDGTVQQFPRVPEGYTSFRGADGQWHIQQVPGALDALHGSAAATASGQATAKIAPTQYDAQGNPMPTTSVANVLNGGGNQSAPAPIRNNNPGALMPGGKLAQYPDMQSGLAALDQNLQNYAKQGVNTLAGVISKWAPPNENNTQAYIADAAKRLGIDPNQKIDLTNPAVRQAVGTAIMLHENGPSGVFGSSQPTGKSFPAPPLGAEEGANTGSRNLQDEMSKDYSALSATNAQAQTTNSYLQEIKTLAQKAAVGPFSDKLDFANELLSFAHASTRATDAVTANDLLDKYSNQIVARLGTGGLGTDAARAILQAAYPGAHMTAQAINDAVDNLVGANQMVQAKAKILTPLRNSGNAKAYNDAKLTFDQNADPRIWQYMNIQDPVQRAAFAKQTLQQDPHFADKIKALESIGAIQ